MRKQLLKISLVSALILSVSSAFGQGSSCAEMEPICTDVGISFTAGVGDVAEPGNDYGCLYSQPNPSWYYLEIAVGGDIEMELFAGSDIDFIIWGPFDDLADAISNCGTLGGVESPIVDCSYSGVAYETPEITGCVPGEVYILLITNYAAIVQDVTLGKIGGDAETDCDIVVVPPCEAFAGTFTLKKNGLFIPSDDPIYLCYGDSYEIVSNGDYTLPNDTIPAPIGDGIYTAQLMWLVYDGVPVGADPFADPNYMGIIIPTEDLMDIHDADSPLGALGCGTYYLVPVAGDDGVGDGGANDNFSVTWDKNGNGCYDLGTPIQITYSCEIEAVITVNCDGDYRNGVDFDLSGGSGSYSIVNEGDGDLVAGVVPAGGIATIENLENGSAYQITVTDAEGCSSTFSGIFAAPILNPITITPAVSCPDASVGTVNANIIPGSGQGAPYAIVMNGIPTPGLTASYSDIAGTSVTIIAIDKEGCVSDSVVTITSAGHFIDIDVLTKINLTCFGYNDGSASIEANPENEFGADDGEVVSITWTDPTGASFPGGPANTSRTGMMAGTWFVTVLDDFGCEVTIAIVITSPAELVLYVNASNSPTCYGYSDGSIDLGITGGTPSFDFSWKDLPGENSDVLNTINAGAYWGYVEDANGCQDSILVNISEPDSLYAVFTLKNVLCYGDSTGAIIINDVFNGSGVINYFWDLGGVIPNPPPNVNLADGLPAGTYFVTIQDEFCDNLYEFRITQNSEITLNQFGFYPAYCRIYDYQNGNGQVYAAAIGGVADYHYEWENLTTGATSPNSTWGGLNPGDYKITVTDNVGCQINRTLTVDSLNPIADFTVTSEQLNGDLQGTETVFATFTNTSLNFANPLNPFADTTFFWNLNYDNTDWILSEDWNETFDTIYNGEMVYRVCLVAINKNGCTDTTCKDITVYAQPDFIAYNIFTPNGDQKNDLFTFNFGAQGIAEFECVIVDRWGKVMFEFTDVNQGWDGTTPGGNQCSDGVYFYTYKVKYTNGTKSAGQGNVTLVRG